MQPDQIKLIHAASGKKGAGLDRAGYELVLRNVGRVDTCKNLTQAGFEDCMAVFEEMEEGAHPERTEHRTYWRDVVARRAAGFASKNQIWMIRQLYAQFEAARDVGETHYELTGLVARHSKSRTIDPVQLFSHEAYKLTETLKAMISRLACGETPGREGKHWPHAAEPPF